MSEGEAHAELTYTRDNAETTGYLSEDNFLSCLSALQEDEIDSFSVKLLKDVTVSAILTIKKSMTFDLNNCTFTGGLSIADADIDVKIDDTSQNKCGKYYHSSIIIQLISPVCGVPNR